MAEVIYLEQNLELSKLLKTTLGTLEPWNSATLPWKSGTLEFWNPCNPGALELWNPPWNPETLEFWKRWNVGTLKWWNLEILEPWYCEPPRKIVSGKNLLLGCKAGLIVDSTCETYSNIASLKSWAPHRQQVNRFICQWNVFLFPNRGSYSKAVPISFWGKRPVVFENRLGIWARFLLVFFYPKVLGPCTLGDRDKVGDLWHPQVSFFAKTPSTQQLCDMYGDALATFGLATFWRNPNKPWSSWGCKACPAVVCTCNERCRRRMNFFW